MFPGSESFHPVPCIRSISNSRVLAKRFGAEQRVIISCRTILDIARPSRSTVRNSEKYEGKPTIGAWAALLLRCLGQRAVSPRLLPIFLVYGSLSVRALITLFLTRECVVVITEDSGGRPWSWVWSLASGRGALRSVTLAPGWVVFRDHEHGCNHTTRVPGEFLLSRRFALNDVS